MKAEDWHKIEKLLGDALELAPFERGDFLDRTCASDTDLRDEVESLLACEAASEKLLQSPAIALFDGLFGDDLDEPDTLVGQTIGNYRIIRELGRGGMGAVYLAEREQPDFVQRVAVKLLRRELNTADIRQRFRRERQILASLEHPNITRLLDVGATQDGVPFFVMEYVEAVSVDAFCLEKELSLEAILKLFQRICRTVAFAHRNLVVHRDLKPSNILVTAEGTPKLLDFGISKLLTSEFESDSGAYTVTNFGAMTPEYASPEQLRGETITTASDIYSLGVVLYELLTGNRPFHLKNQSLDAAIHAVCETSPARPSQMITSYRDTKNREEAKEKVKYETDVTGTPEAKTRKFTGTAVQRPGDTEKNLLLPNFNAPRHVSGAQLKGDVDNIVLKALRKEPERRYSTVEKFAEDIERHLNGLPISARPNTFAYRAEKFIKRNRLSVAAGLSIILILLGGIAATLWQSRRAEQQRFIAEEQRERASKRFNDVRKLANSFLFEIYPQIENLEGATAARETLVKRALEYLDSLSKEASDDAGLQRELAAAYEKVSDVQGNPNQSNLGDTKGALESCQKAQRLRESLVAQNPANPELRHELAANYEKTGVILWWSDETGKAIEDYEKALALRRQLVAENPDSIEYQKGLAGLQMNYGDVPAWNKESEMALTHFREAQTILENLVTKNPEDRQLKADLGRALTRVGRTQKDIQDFDSANATLEKAQRIFLLLAAENPNNYDFGRGLWKVRFNQCEMFLVKPDDKRAVETCSQLIDLAENLVKKDAKDTLMKHDLVSSHNYAGDAFLQAHMLNEAAAEFQKALNVNAELLAQFPDSSEYKRNVAVLNLDLGKTNLYLGKTAAALENNQTAQKLLEEIAAGDKKNSVPRFNLATAYQQLGENYAKQHNAAEARNWFNRALEILQKLDTEGSLALRDQKLIPEVQSEIARVR